MHTAVAPIAERDCIQQLEHHPEVAPSIEPPVTCMVDLQAALRMASFAPATVNPQTGGANPTPSLGLQIVGMSGVDAARRPGVLITEQSHATPSAICRPP
jgi:hypothetical protein